MSNTIAGMLASQRLQMLLKIAERPILGLTLEREIERIDKLLLALAKEDNHD